MSAVAPPIEIIPPSTIIPQGTPAPSAPATTPAETQPAPTAETPSPTPAEPANTPPEGAPDRYELTTPAGLPEGYEIDTEVRASIEKVARDLNLPQKSVQRLLDTVWPVMHQRGQAEHSAIISGWKSEVAADHEIGGRHANDTQRNIALARDKLGTPELTKFLDGGAGHHPELVRFFSRVGKLFAQDAKLVTGAAPARSTDYSDADQMASVLFPNTPKVI